MLSHTEGIRIPTVCRSQPTSDPPRTAGTDTGTRSLAADGRPVRRARLPTSSQRGGHRRPGPAYTKGAVYSNFAAKEDVFFAVYERRAERASCRDGAYTVRDYGLVPRGRWTRSRSRAAAPPRHGRGRLACRVLRILGARGSAGRRCASVSRRSTCVRRNRSRGRGRPPSRSAGTRGATSWPSTRWSSGSRSSDLKRCLELVDEELGLRMGRLFLEEMRDAPTG